MKYVPKRPLIIKNRAMGDAIIGLSTIQYLKEVFPDAYIYYGIPKWVSPLFTHIPHAGDEVLPIELNGLKDWWNLAKLLREKKIDCIFEMFQSGRTKKFFSLYSKIFNIPYLAHNHHKKEGGVFDQGVIKSNIQRDLDGAWTYFGDPSKYPHFLKYEPKSPLNIKKENHLILGVVATRETKKWDLKNYVSIIKMVEEECPHWKVIIPLSKSHDDQKIKHHLIKQGLSLNYFLEASLEELPLKLASSKVYLGNDTGLKHISITLGIKTFTIFGPEPPTEWHPYAAERHPYFYIPDLECRVRDAHYCGLNFCDSMVCLKQITPEVVWEKLKEELRDLEK